MTPVKNDYGHILAQRGWLVKGEIVYHGGTEHTEGEEGREV